MKKSRTPDALGPMLLETSLTFSLLVLPVAGFIFGGKKGNELERENDTLTQALISIAEGNINNACTELRHFMTEFPESIRVYRVLGAFYRKNREFDRALRIHQNIYHSPSTNADQKCDALMELALDYAEMGDLVKAAEVLEQVTEEYPKKLRANRLVAQVYIDLGEWEKAYRQIHKFMRRQKGWDTRVLAALQYQVGIQALKEENYRKALQCFSNSEDLDSTLPGGYEGQGLAYIGLRRYAKAVNALERGLEKTPAAADRLLPVLRKAYYAWKKYDVLEGVLRQFLAEQPNSASGYLILAEHLESQHQLEEAHKVLDQGIQVKPEDYTLRRAFIRLVHKDAPQTAGEEAFRLLEELPLPATIEEQEVTRVIREMLSRDEEADFEGTSAT